MDAQTFNLEAPEIESGRAIVHLPRTDSLFFALLVLKEGGENTLHSHPNLDGVWLVMEGRVRFYTEGDKLVAELGKNEGILIPRGYKYWFESVGKAPLHILQFESIIGGGQIKTERHAPQKFGVTKPPPRNFKQGPNGLVETDATPS